MSKTKIKLPEIESSIYAKDGIFSRVMNKISEIGTAETARITGKKRQRIDILKRQYSSPDKFDYRPKFETIKEIAEKLGVE